MIHKIIASQIPQFWDTIKFAALHTDNIAERDRQLYLNNLLAHLLCDKAQCFVRSNDNRELLAIVITRINKDEITGERSLYISSLYSFKPVADSEWIADVASMERFARANDCKKIIAVSSNQRIFDIAASLGFIERYRSFSLEV